MKARRKRMMRSTVSRAMMPSCPRVPAFFSTQQEGH